jgi:hypothetical protein
MTTNFHDDAEVFGQDLIDTTQRWTAPVVAQQVNQLRGELRQTQSQLARERVMAFLDRDPQLGSQWRTINDDPAFLQWLAQVDEANGVPRLGLLRQAFDLGASDRVAHFFRSYIASKTPPRQRTAERLPMEDGRARPAITRADVDGRRKVWSRAEISRFYADCRNGRYDGRESDRLRIEADILAAAQQQGRIADPPMDRLR